MTLRHLCTSLFALAFLAACSVDIEVTDDEDKDGHYDDYQPNVMLSVKLDGHQQVPMVYTELMTYAKVHIDEEMMMISAELDLAGLDDVSAAHIHAGKIGMNGPAAFTFEPSDEEDTWVIEPIMVSEDELDALWAGEWYINLHTMMYPDGEIRGQIVGEDMAIVTFKLGGDQSVPMNDTEAMGQAYAVVDTDDYYVDLTVNTMGIDDATMAHIHEGYIGENGGVVIALEAYDDENSVWVLPAGSMLDEDVFMQLLDGGHYVNIHSDTFGSGEIRGQIVDHSVEVITFKLDGEQQTPFVDTDAMGYGYATFDHMDYELDLTITTMGVDDATAAHIHSGTAGMSGGVIFTLEQDVENMAVWSLEATLDTDQAEQLLDAGYYVNVHTPANPSGEIRGQVLTDNFIITTFLLTAEQQVPDPVSSAALGWGYATLNNDDWVLDLTVWTTGADDATAAHIHQAPAGENGDAVVTLEQSDGDVALWTANEPLDADTVEVLLDGGHYVNVHTPANPSGEIRGQIE